MFSLCKGFYEMLTRKPSFKILIVGCDNAGKSTYIDRNDVCFQYIVNKVDCDKNEERITAYPIQ